MKDSGRERRGLLQQLTPFMTDSAPLIQEIREKETQREEKEEERKERHRQKREEFLSQKEQKMEDLGSSQDMQESIDEDTGREGVMEGKMKEGKEERDEGFPGDVGALSASGNFCAFLSQDELQEFRDPASRVLIDKATAYITTLEAELMSKTRDLRDANETISTLFRSQDLEGRSSSSTEPPRPKFRGGGEEGGFGGEEDFVLPGQMTGGPGFGGNPHRTPPRTRNHFEELYLQSQRKYDELVITCVTLTSELEDLKKTAEAVKLFNPSSASVSLPSLSPNRPSSPAPSSPSSLNSSIDSSKGVDVFNDIAALLDDLNQKMSIQTNMSRKEAELARMFLEGLKNKKEAQRDKIVTQLQLIDADSQKLANLIESLPEDPSSSSSFLFPGKEGKEEKLDTEEDTPGQKKRQRESSNEAGKPSEVKRKRIVTQNMEELQQAYFTVKKQGESDENVLETFIRKHLQPCVIHTELSCISVLRHRAESSNFLEGAIRAVAVDPSGSTCAVAGVSRAIQIFALPDENKKQEKQEAEDEEGMEGGKKVGGVEFSSDFGDTVGGVSEGPASTFLDVGSCVTGLSWSPTRRNVLTSVDARGHVMIWDVTTGSLISPASREHDPCACTSVDFCPTEPDLFATSAEDSTVRIWHLSQQEKSTAQITVPSAVLSVKWNPVLESQLAFVCSDKVFTYDIRMIDAPIFVSPSYRRLSGMGWCRRDTLVTQSLDNTMKMWEVNKKGFSPSPVRSYQGHQNNVERVGIACTADYIATGSENNSVYVYSTNFSNPSFTHTFNTNLPMEDEDAFVSAVGWSGKGDVLVAGNSRGTVKVLSMEK